MRRVSWPVRATPDFWAGLACGLAVSTALGAGFGLLALRTNGVYFLMITLALAQVAWAVALPGVTSPGGDDGLRGIPRPTLDIPGVNLSGTSAFYAFALAAFVIALVLMRAILRSPFGRSLPGVKDSEARMDALGYNVWLHKYIAFVLSAGFSGFAGVLLAYYRGFVSPEATSIIVSAEVMLMVILGGAATLVGPVLGAFVIILLSNFISAYTAHWTLILGALYAIVVLAAPAGIVGEMRAVISGAGAEVSNERALRARRRDQFRGRATRSKNVTLEVAVGERRVLMGPNGAGKTTLFNVIGGQLRPHRGRTASFSAAISLRCGRSNVLIWASHGPSRSQRCSPISPSQTTSIWRFKRSTRCATPCCAARRASTTRSAGSKASSINGGSVQSAPLSCVICLMASSASSNSPWHSHSGRACCCSTSRLPGCRGRRPSTSSS